jgi:hypothetical protein
MRMTDVLPAVEQTISLRDVLQRDQNGRKSESTASQNVFSMYDDDDKYMRLAYAFMRFFGWSTIKGH